MASMEDYDEFGNYIGADLDSDDEDASPQETFQAAPRPQQHEHAPLEGFDDEQQPESADSMALMELDG